MLSQVCSCLFLWCVFATGVGVHTARSVSLAVFFHAQGWVWGYLLTERSAHKVNTMAPLVARVSAVSA